MVYFNSLSCNQFYSLIFVFGSFMKINVFLKIPSILAIHVLSLCGTSIWSILNIYLTIDCSRVQFESFILYYINYYNFYYLLSSTLCFYRLTLHKNSTRTEKSLCVAFVMLIIQINVIWKPTCWKTMVLVNQTNAKIVVQALHGNLITTGIRKFVVIFSSCIV